MTISDDKTFSVTVVRVDGGPVVHPIGEVDFAAKSAFIDAVVPLIEDQPGRPLVIDMRQVTFLDSSGVAALVILARQAAAAGATLAVRNASERTRKVLQTAGLHQTLLELEPPIST